MGSGLQVGDFFLEARLLFQEGVVVCTQAQVLFRLLLVLPEQQVLVVGVSDLLLGGAVLHELHFAHRVPELGLP